MPLPWHDDDCRCDMVVRATMAELESPAWWKALGIDGLVLYSWAAPKYTKVVRAAHRAGITVLIHLDRDPVLFPAPGVPMGKLAGLFRLVKMAAFHMLSGRHMLYADYLTASYPVIESLKRSWLYPRSLRSKFRQFPCPVAAHFSYDGTPKENLVVCVGRWSDDPVDEVKRPGFLREIAEQLVDLNKELRFEIYGRCGESMTKWHEQLREEKKERIKLMGAVPNNALVQAYCRAKVSVCPSLSEGTHIASAEALSCGVSIVMGPQPRLGTLHSYTRIGAGSIALENMPASYAQAIVQEMAAWDRGERNPDRIAAAAKTVFGAGKAILRIFNEG